ncbi:hypothetical protein N9Y51_04120 [Alphaproteobacteria bacterium]|nr:hypothetical protein [Alphaproteobacteria bacterium]
MSIATYDGLKAAIANWLNRTDLTAEIPDFIELAENRILHEIRTPTNEKTILLSVNSEGYATLPSDFLEAKDIFWNYNPLKRVSLTEIHSYQDQAGVPTCFARETYRLKFFPTSGTTSANEARMIYYYDVGRLASDTQTNVMLTMAPEVYLYASLVEASNFLGSDGSRWETGYRKAVAQIVKHTREAEVAGSTPQVNSGY